MKKQIKKLTKPKKNQRYISFSSSHLCLKSLNNQEDQKQHMVVDKLLKTTQYISKIVSTQVSKEYKILLRIIATEPMAF